MHFIAYNAVMKLKKKKKNHKMELCNFQFDMFVQLWEFGRSANMWDTFSEDGLCASVNLGRIHQI